MNDPTQSSDIQSPEGEQSQAEALESPGDLLRAERERQGLELADLARQLNLSKAKLEALEQDNFAKLPSEVFVQGYLRRYSKLLGLDDDQIVHHYNVLLGRHRADEASQLASGSARSGALGPPRWLLPVGIFAIGLLVLAFVFMQTASDDGGEPGSPAPVRQPQAPVEERQPPPPAQPSESGDEEDPPAQGGPFEAERPMQAEAPLEAGERDVINTAPAAPATASQATAPDQRERDAAGGENSFSSEDTVASEDTVIAEDAGIGDDIVSFAFSEDCWVEVSNAEGTVIYQDLASAGESLSVEGEAPFSVLLGNARAASVSFNGEVVAVSPPPGNRTHRFTVGQGQ